jgi:hypothetical protein
MLIEYGEVEHEGRLMFSMSYHLPFVDFAYGHVAGVWRVLSLLLKKSWTCCFSVSLT